MGRCAGLWYKVENPFHIRAISQVRPLIVRRQLGGS
jgi:hypothetical protein